MSIQASPSRPDSRPLVGCYEYRACEHPEPGECAGSDRRHARVWLEFGREVGHDLSPIEAAIVADETKTPTDLSDGKNTSTGMQDKQAGDGVDGRIQDEGEQDEDDRDGPVPDPGHSRGRAEPGRGAG